MILNRREQAYIAALGNPNLCTGTAADWQLKAWFGDRGLISREEIAAKQADEFSRQAESQMDKFFKRR